ncbi:DedA family protein [Gordonia oryzae]|uniref:DedA family protein n=1 Tax=Gordonia oryzae TaxID=2487349 RepID=A0A3N4GPU7_9ACTN|nr:DedA family protein [Gordonia oryzae]RPA64933.1 DedA family protein [Gordonia oryzae]
MQTFADWLTGVIESVPSWAVYLIAAGIVYLETALLIAGLVMPSEAVLLAAGVAAAVGSTNIAWLVVIVVLCAVAGDATGYWLGRLGGQRLKESGLGRRIGEQRWHNAQQRLERSGLLVVGTGRWVGYVRTIVPRVAGISRMSVVRFGIADAIGALTWASAVLLAGYFAGAVLGATILLYAVIALGGVVAVFYGVSWTVRRWHRGDIG